MQMDGQAGSGLLASGIMRVFVFLAVAALAQCRQLEIFFIDTEGGQATLIVSPSGQSLLIGAGWTDFSGRDADRIADAAKRAHVKKIDAVLITDHHRENEGGVPNLLERFTVGTFYDPGPSVETAHDHQRTYKAYEEAMAKQHREVVKPGDKIPIKGIEVTVVVAGGAHIADGGEPNPFCAGIEPRAGENAEEARSAGVVVEYGRFRFADLGDLTWNKELALLCPQNRIGRVDLYLASRHGGVTSKAIYGLAPRVVILDNGPRTGADPEAWKTLNASPRLDDLWQLHFALAGEKETNASDTLIANLDEHCAGVSLNVSAQENGSFTVFNPRNKFSKSYNAQ